MTDVAKLPSAPKLEVLRQLAASRTRQSVADDRGHQVCRLKEDIRKNGILEPIKLFEDRILDGRNRHKAGKEGGYRLRRLA